RSFATFNGAQIRSDLTGASSIQSAELFMYCLDAEEARGSLAFGASDATTPPGTLRASLPTGVTQYSFDHDFNVGQWTSVSILGGFLDDILAGANSMHITSPLLSLAATKFGGYANASRRPYIKIKYTKP